MTKADTELERQEERSPRSFFWSYVSKEKMTRLLSIARSRGLSEAIEEVIGKSTAQHYLRQLLSEKRGDFSSLLPVPPSGTILDYGCGWGTISIALSRRFRKILAFDATRENLEFARMRMQAEQRSNILLVQVEPLENSRFPCAPGSVDCVILVGILEWVGNTVLEGSPREMQIRFLQEIRRTLRPNGCIYLAIENRFGAPYWLGRPDPHAFVPFLSLLPRCLANFWMLRRKGRPYRTYTHSHRALERILEAAGFDRYRFYYPATNYRWPSALIPIEDPSAVRRWIRTAFIPRRRTHYLYAALLWLIASLHLLPFLTPDFVVIANRSNC